MEIEIPKRNESALGGKFDRRGQFPVEAAADSHFFVGDRGVIQSGIAAQGAEVFLYAIARSPDVRAGIQR